MAAKTEQLRKMLNELGVKWWEGWNKDITVFDGANGVRYQADCTLGELFIRSILSITPEQAVAATLGAETCKVDVLNTGDCAGYECSEHIMHCNGCGHEFGHVLYNENGDVWMSEPPNYCPNCGRRVVSK